MMLLFGYAGTAAALRAKAGADAAERVAQRSTPVAATELVIAELA